MKVRYLWAMLIGLSLYSCDDNTEGLGSGMFPPGDDITISGKVYHSSSKSIESGPIFAKTNQFYVGKYLDEDFGDYEASFLTQFNCTDSLEFPKLYNENIEGKDKGIMAGDSIVETEIIFNYTSFFGDSISPSSIRLYELNQLLKTDHYTDINPEEFYDPKDILAEASYSGQSLKPEVNPSNPNAPQQKQAFIRFVLDKEIGSTIYKKNRSNKEFFYNNKAFAENVFAGIYAKTIESSGSILYLDNVILNIKFNIHYTDSVGKKILKKDGITDSIRVANMTFASTKEVVQANKLLSDPEMLNKKIAEMQHSYIKAPSGIFTEVTLPIEDLLNDPDKKNDTIININMTFQAYNNDKGNSSFQFKRPSTIGMFKNADYEEFFEKNKVFDYNNNFYTKINQNGQYKFSKLERLIIGIKNEIKEAEDKAKEEAGSSWNKETWFNEWKLQNPDWNKVRLVPIDVAETKNQQGQVTGVTSVRHNVRPEMAKLVGGAIEAGGKEIELRVVFSSYNDEKLNQ